MRRLATAAMAVTLCAVMSATCYATGPRDGGELVLLGARSASMTVMLRSAVAVTNPFRLEAVTQGRYAGYVISDVHGRVLAGSVLVRGLGMSAGEGVPLGFTTHALKPGRYEITLLADGPAKVVIPLSGDSRTTVRPTEPVRVFTRVVRNDKLPASAAGSPLAYSATPVPAGRHQLASLTEFFSGTAALAGQADQCFTTAPLCQLSGDGGSSYLSPGIGESGGYTGVSMTPADFDSGTHAVLDSEDVAAQSRHAGFILILG